MSCAAAWAVHEPPTSSLRHGLFLSPVTPDCGTCHFGKRERMCEGVNYQCLHKQPEYDAYYTSSSGFSVISGSEYQSGYYRIFPSLAHNQNVPCARCYTQRSATVMIPSIRSCPSEWCREYEKSYQYSLLALKECYHWLVGRLTCWLAAGR